ncbi:MAG: cohesin domain-containing protein [Armatimonadota bacterium]
MIITTARITVITLVLLIAASFLCAEEPASIELKNEFIRLVVNKGPDEVGRFSIKTTGGDPSRPSSKDQHLIFGGNAPFTSITTVMVDGEKYVFGGHTRRRAGLNAKYGDLVAAPVIIGNKVTSSYQCGEITVTQELTFVRGLSTRMLDTVGITYRLTNKSDAAHEVGLRVLLYTMCGSNDGAPMRAGSHAITTATTLAGNDVPDFWQAFDNLANPTVISQGTLRGGNTTPPDKILFADWGTLADDVWSPSIEDGQGFMRKGEDELDTAAALFWAPVKVEPNKGLSYTTYYGIGEVSLKPGNLTLGLTAPAETTFAHERTQTVTVTAYLQNAGGFDARDVSLSLALPTGLTLVGAGKLKQDYQFIRAGDTVQQSWTFKADGNAGGKLKLNLSVTSANIEANAISREIQVNIPPQTVVMYPGMQKVQAITNGRPTKIPIEVNLTPADQFYGIRFTLTYDPKIIQPLLGASRGRAFVEDGTLLREGFEYNDLVDGKITVIGKRTDAKPITQAEVNLAGIVFYVTGTGKSPLIIENAVLINEKGLERPVQVSAGEVEVINGLPH